MARRDLSREVGGIMTLQALDMLEKDPQTELILILSKPPAPETMARLTQSLQGRSKPIIMACLGLPDQEKDGISKEESVQQAINLLVKSR